VCRKAVQRLKQGTGFTDIAWQDTGSARKLAIIGDHREGQPKGNRCVSTSNVSEIEIAGKSDRHALVHVVHGSKTGLIMPEPRELHELSRRYGRFCGLSMSGAVHNYGAA